MPDYASILRRSISALPDPTPEMREAVYQRARAALARQLTAVEPPLSTKEIEAQHRELEDAVVRLEVEYAPEPADEPEPFEAPAEEDVYYSAPQGRNGAYRQPAEGNLDEDLEREDEPGEDEEEEYEGEEGRSSRLPLLVAASVLVLAIGGIGAYAYTQRDTLLDFLGGETVAVVEATPAPVAAPEPEPEQPAGETAAADDPNKLPDRLTNGSELAPAEPEVAAAEAEPAPVLPAEDPVLVEPLPTESGTLEEEQTAALPQPDQGIVAQRAIYYFQGTEGSPGRAVEGSVTWEQISRDGAPAVQAILRVAEPEVTTTLTIYKNNDASLPASHMVEVEFQGALGTTAIQRVPALVLKSTEQARGEPLAGAAVPVTDELFWIALSDDADEVTRNVTLLREGAWFDIPILFTDGTRALLTFEKGTPGERVFETVMSSWTPT
jgi:hypothetical protein